MPPIYFSFRKDYDYTHVHESAFFSSLQYNHIIFNHLLDMEIKNNVVFWEMNHYYTH